MNLAILSLIAVAFVVSWGLTYVVTRVAPRVGFTDQPGHRKIHTNPKPLGGGIAIFLAIALPIMAGILTLMVSDSAARQRSISEHPLQNKDTLPEYRSARVGPFDVDRPLIDGAIKQIPLAIGLLGAMLILHVMGLVDDKKALGPYSKLIIQLAVTSIFVVWFDVRALTALGYVPSVVLTVLWITAITNAFNFLDNMDGLSAGIGAVASVAFLVTALMLGQWFVAATLALLLGALVGFLCFNFNPASIFMGDSGSLLIGFVLGVLTVRTTFVLPDLADDFASNWYAVLAPVVVLAVPLYDLIVVSLIRLSRGKSPFQGDTNHFSHRLVARGMSKRTAVLCLWLITASTSVAAILLTQVRSGFGASLIFAQTLMVLAVVMLLEQHPLPQDDSKSRDEEPRNAGDDSTRRREDAKKG